MFRPLCGHRQAFLKQVVKKLHTLLGSQLRLQSLGMYPQTL